MRWSEIAPYLTRINEATRLRLLVFVAACHGFDAAALIQPLSPAPFRVLIGPLRAVETFVVDQATTVFYRELFKTGDGGAAVRMRRSTRICERWGARRRRATSTCSF